MGAALAGANVSLKDQNGVERTAMTDATGDYSIDVLGLTPPFMVEVVSPPPIMFFLHSFGSGPGTINVTPFTDVMATAFFRVQGLDADVEFASLDTATQLPNASQLGILEQIVQDIAALWLSGEGVDLQTFDFVTTPFAADGTGVDAMLDLTFVVDDGVTTSITIEDGITTSQVSDLTVDVASSRTTVATTVTSSAGTTESQSTTVIPFSDGEVDAVTGILQTMAQFAATINAQGSNLADSHLAPFWADDFLDQGQDKTRSTGETASSLRGQTASSFAILAVHSIDEAMDIADVTLSARFSSGTASQSERFRMGFREVGATWLLWGNREIADVGVQVELRVDQESTGTTASKHVNVDVRAERDTIASVTITGGGVFDDTTVVKAPTTAIEEYQPTPGGPVVEVESDAFFASADFGSSFPPAGTEFLVTVTPVLGSPETYSVISAGTTTETVTNTSPTGHELTDANLGGTLTTNTGLPTTFAIVRGDAGVSLHTMGFSKFIDPEEFVADQAQTLTYNLPTEVNGQAVTSATINRSFNGPNGERIQILYHFR